jgi:hypothetical protein
MTLPVTMSNLICSGWFTPAREEKHPATGRWDYRLTEASGVVLRSGN